jgi:hypothetical protein
MKFWSTRSFGALAAVLLFPTLAPAVTVTTDGFRLKADGKLFVAKGVNYSPVPIGTNPGQIPYGDYFVKAYDNVWKPDIDKMRAADVNVIKLYAGNPALNAGAPGTAGNWKAFLDYCYNGGKNPIYVVMMSYVQGGVIADGGAAYNQYVTDYTNLVKSTVTHPAVFGYLVGNEIFGGVTDNPNFWANYGALVDAAHQAGLSQGKDPFLSTAIVDNYTPQDNWPAITKGEESGKVDNLDAWMINVYRGPNLGGPSNLVFPQYKDVMTNLGVTKPLLLGEWGTPHTTRPANVYGQNVTTPVRNLDNVANNQMGSGEPYFAAIPVPKFLTSCWSAIKTNVGAGADQVCAGGFIFSWCDEYWKGNNDNTQVGGPSPDFQGGAFAGGYADEAGYGLSSAVDNARYGKTLPIQRDFFKGYGAMNTFYGASSQSGGELYAP